MRPAAELKEIFQAGWNISARVQNYVRNVADGEFAEPACSRAWSRALAEALAAEGAQKVLDVGTGPGIFACLYAQLGHECVGLDFSEAMLAEARRRAARLGASCSFVFGDAEAPPFADACFDAVSSRHVLFTLPRPGAAVHQWVRVLKPGGRLILIGDDVRERNNGMLATVAERAKRRWNKWFGASGARGWSAGPEYLKALDECPLFKNNPLLLRTLMEAAGLRDIRAISTDDILLARTANRSARGNRIHARARPFVLVGTR